MSLDPPPYISSLQSNIRARPISWEGAVRAKTISEADLKAIKSIDKVRREQRRQTVENDTEGYTTLLLGGGQDGDERKSIFEKAAKRGDIVQYILVLMGDLIDDIPQLTSKILSHPSPYAPFLPLLSTSTPEEPIPILTSVVLSSLLSAAIMTYPKLNPQISSALPKTYSYLSVIAKSQDSSIQDIAVQQLSALLRTSASRRQFWDQREESLGPLIEILRAATGGGDSSASSTINGHTASASGSSTMFSRGSTPSMRSGTEVGIGGGVGVQLLYHVLLVMWQLSFEGGLVGPGLEEDHNIIALYARLLRLSPKEKTTRLLLSTLHNLLSANRDTLLPVAVLARLPTLFQNLSTRHLNDADLLEDLKSLRTMMEEHQSSQTTFTRYADEVHSGKLRPSPPHRDQQFWKDNARQIIEHENGELIKALAAILAKNWDSDKAVLALACNDVAMMVKQCPDKRDVLAKVGLKGRTMELMQDSDESVRWEALNALGGWLRYGVGGS